MAGILYGVGVGPGDPELMTLKAVRLIQSSQIIAVPGAVPQETMAYKIAVQSVPELKHKTLVPIFMPMTHDKGELLRNHEKGARMLEQYLSPEKDVVFLTLGDPTIYSTFTYIQRLVERHGYQTAMVSGIPSFCAAAACVNTPLVTWNEQLHILPAVHSLEHELSGSGNYVLMKSGRSMKRVKERLSASGRTVVAVENCGTRQEHIYRSVEEIPDDAGYYSLIIAKERFEP